MLFSNLESNPSDIVMGEFLYFLEQYPKQFMENGLNEILWKLGIFFNEFLVRKSCFNSCYKSLCITFLRSWSHFIFGNCGSFTVLKAHKSINL